MRTVLGGILASIVVAGAYAAIANRPEMAGVPAIAAIVAVPEPVTMGFIGFSLIGLGVLNRKRRS